MFILAPSDRASPLAAATANLPNSHRSVEVKWMQPSTGVAGVGTARAGVSPEGLVLWWHEALSL